MNEMQKWLKNYMNERHPENLREPNPGWQSSKYDFSDPDVRLEYVPEMGCSVGGCISALKKQWKSYKACGRNGEPRSWQAWNIRKIQSALGLEKSSFPELEGMSDEEESDQELTDEELEAQREQKAESAGREWSNLNFPHGTSEEKSEPYTDEWSEEDKQLLKEEIEAEEDWWFS